MLARNVPRRGLFGILIVLMAIIVACGGEAEPAPTAMPAPTMDPSALGGSSHVHSTGHSTDGPRPV